MISLIFFYHIALKSADEPKIDLHKQHSQPRIPSYITKLWIRLHSFQHRFLRKRSTYLVGLYTYTYVLGRICGRTFRLCNYRTKLIRLARRRFVSRRQSASRADRDFLVYNVSVCVYVREGQYPLEQVKWRDERAEIFRGVCI